jgi:hypothetical protein
MEASECMSLMVSVMGILKEEHTLWCVAGAKKPQGLGLGLAGII